MNKEQQAMDLLGRIQKRCDAADCPSMSSEARRFVPLFLMCLEEMENMRDAASQKEAKS